MVRNFKIRLKIIFCNYRYNFFFLDPLTKGFSEENIYRSDIYKPLYCLVSHEGKRCLPELVSMTMNVAVILYFVFTLTSFFGETTSKSLEALSDNEDAIFIGKLIAHHYMIIQVNDHEVLI